MSDYLSIKDQLQSCRSKEETFKSLVALSKQLPRLSDSEKVELNKVKGCESAVWIVIEKQDGGCHFKADSDAKLMRGVLFAILSIVEGKDLSDIQGLDLVSELNSLNLGSYLTSSRSNGVLAILERVRTP